jgi:hypothetical protein
VLLCLCLVAVAAFVAVRPLIGRASLISIDSSTPTLAASLEPSSPARPNQDSDLTKTLRALRRELRAKEGKSRKLRQQLKSVFKPDPFAPQEPTRSERKSRVIRYGTANAIRYPGDDDRHYHNQWYFDYEAPAFTGKYDDTARQDDFSPDEPWNHRDDSISLDGTVADLRHACQKAGKGHSWDPVHHQCLYKGVPPLPEMPRGRGVTQEGPSRQAIDGGPIAGEACQGDDVDEFGACRPQPEGEVDQYGWRPGDVSRNGFKNPYDPLSPTQKRGFRERDTTLDYQTADLEKACRRQMRKPVVGSFYSWDAWHARCLYFGRPVTHKRPEPRTTHPLTDGKYWDLKQECLRRGMLIPATPTSIQNERGWGRERAGGWRGQWERGESEGGF